MQVQYYHYFLSSTIREIYIKHVNIFLTVFISYIFKPYTVCNLCFLLLLLFSSYLDVICMIETIFIDMIIIFIYRPGPYCFHIHYIRREEFFYLYATLKFIEVTSSSLSSSLCHLLFLIESVIEHFNQDLESRERQLKSKFSKVIDCYFYY